MTPRCFRYAPTDESRIPHWLVTYDVYRRVLASKHLAIGTDLHAALREVIEECEADGWTVEKDSAYGFFFRNRGGERRAIRMQPTDPSGFTRRSIVEGHGLSWPNFPAPMQSHTIALTIVVALTRSGDLDPLVLIAPSKAFA